MIQHSILVHRTDISRLTIDREKWKIKKRKTSEEQNIKKKRYDQTRGRTGVNIRAVFQHWRELKEREGLESDAEVVRFLHDRGVMLILHCFTKLICVGFCLNMLVSSLVSEIIVMPGLCTYVWGGDIKIGAGPVGLWACLFWCFQISTSFGKKRLVHL